jgi:4-hydroxy-2-oxoglutarate aldolase
MTIASQNTYTAGVHVPSLTWFRDDAEQEIDWDVQRKHFEFLVDGDVHGSMICSPRSL